MSETALVHRGNDLPAATSGWDSSSPGTAIIKSDPGAASVLAREESEMRAAIVLARNFPRDEHAAYTRVIKSCRRASFAEDALYSFRRGNSRVEGPSVSLAREIARCWGNVRYGVRVVSIDDEMVHIKGYAHDLESNNYVELEDRFARLIQRKKGPNGPTEWVRPDERDLRELINRRGAILERNCILKVIPPDVVDEAMDAARQTMREAAEGEIKQDRTAAIRRLALAFDQLGITTDMLAEYLGHELSLLTEDELVHLRGVYRSIVDGNSRREEYFNVRPAGGAADLNARIQRQAGAPAGAEQPVRAAASGRGRKTSLEQLKERYEEVRKEKAAELDEHELRAWEHWAIGTTRDQWTMADYQKAIERMERGDGLEGIGGNNDSNGQPGLGL